MSFLSKIFGGNGEPSAGARETPVSECAHGALAPRYKDPERPAKGEQPTHFYCEDCGNDFTVDDAERIRIRSV